MAVCQNLVPLVNIKIAGKWMFIPLKMVLIGIDPYPYNFIGVLREYPRRRDASTNESILSPLHDVGDPLLLEENHRCLCCGWVRWVGFKVGDLSWMDLFVSRWIWLGLDMIWCVITRSSIKHVKKETKHILFAIGLQLLALKMGTYRYPKISMAKTWPQLSMVWDGWGDNSREPLACGGCHGQLPGLAPLA